MFLQIDVFLHVFAAGWGSHSKAEHMHKLQVVCGTRKFCTNLVDMRFYIFSGASQDFFFFKSDSIRVCDLQQLPQGKEMWKECINAGPERNLHMAGEDYRSCMLPTSFLGSDSIWNLELYEILWF